MNDSYNITSFTAGNCYSYIIADSDQAIIVDPHITLPDQYERTLKKKNLSLIGIIDTHTHADHISSAAILKKKFDVPLYMSEKAESSIDVNKLKEGDKVKVGSENITVMCTPGHTDDSITLLTDSGDLFTGDTLLINSIGRTDFQNGSPEDMFEALQKLKQLPDNTTVRPAHDYKGNKTSTIESQKKSNPYMIKNDKSAFVEELRSKTLAKPANMDTIIDANRKGSASAFTKISPKEAYKKITSSDGILLDVRTPQEITETSPKIQNVKNIPLQSLDGSIPTLPADKSYYVLCKSGQRATMAAMQLMHNGFSKVSVIEGGLMAWQKAKLPVNKTEGPMSLERQVRIAAGSLALIGGLLSFINPWFAVIPVFVGCGLVYAGVTDTCMMATLLMKLPYNKKPPSSGGGCSLDSGGACSLDSGDSGGGCSV